MKYVYFISYTFTSKDGTGSGNTIVARDGKINSVIDIRDIERGLIEGHDLFSVIVNNYILMSKEK